jgi:hypothetical protein
VTITDPILRIIVSIGLACAGWLVARARLTFRSSTLYAAWCWTAVGLAVWCATWILDPVSRFVSRSAADHLWYACAILALCPAMAVLGSRRPGVRVWTWFIQLPMLLVLGWPALSLWIQGSDVRGLQIETPQLVAYLLVLVMGAGNYLGTRFTLPSLCYAAANVLIAVSSSVASPVWLADRSSARVWSAGLMAAAIVLSGRSQPLRLEGGSLEGGSRFDRLWLDFFDQFGVVWGRRIQDRVNYMAEKERWPARLQLHGFEWTAPADEATEARIEHTFRWLLRRFVDPSWIDERLGTGPADREITALGADS